MISQSPRLASSVEPLVAESRHAPSPSRTRAHAARRSPRAPLQLAGLLALAVSMIAPPLRAADDWEQISQKDSVTVERRPRPGSSFYELRARAVCPVAPQAFFDTVWNYRDYPAFVPYLKSLSVLEEHEGSGTLYQQIAMPLVSDRDYTVHIARTIGADGRSWQIRFDSADDAGPPPGSAFVRARNIHGSWTIEPADGGRATQVTYQLYSEPGGAVPSWIVNLAQRDAPRELLLAMLRRAREHKLVTTASTNR